MPILRNKPLQHITYTRCTWSDLRSTHEIICNVSSWKITDTGLWTTSRKRHTVHTGQWDDGSRPYGSRARPSSSARGSNVALQTYLLRLRLTQFLTKCRWRSRHSAKKLHSVPSVSLRYMLDLPVQDALTSSRTSREMFVRVEHDVGWGR